nr:MAG TPA: hypothetical protein [Caudoviricetes sp.]
MNYKKFEDIPKVMGVNLLDSQLDYDYIIDICNDFYNSLTKYVVSGRSYLIKSNFSFAVGKNINDILMRNNSNILKYDTNNNFETLFGMRVDVVLDETLANAIIIW